VIDRFSGTTGSLLSSATLQQPVQGFPQGAVVNPSFYMPSGSAAPNVLLYWGSFNNSMVIAEDDATFHAVSAFGAAQGTAGYTTVNLTTFFQTTGAPLPPGVMGTQVTSTSGGVDQLVIDNTNSQDPMVIAAGHVSVKYTDANGVVQTLYYSLLFRLDAATGALDPGFGTGGILATIIPPGNGTTQQPMLHTAVVWPDGSVVAAGSISPQFLVTWFAASTTSTPAAAPQTAQPTVANTATVRPAAVVDAPRAPVPVTPRGHAIQVKRPVSLTSLLRRRGS
jgi:hypothetical protein